MEPFDNQDDGPAMPGPEPNPTPIKPILSLPMGPVLPDELPTPSHPWRRRLVRAAAVIITILAVGAGYLYWQAQQIVNEFQAGPKREIVEAVEPELNVDPVELASLDQAMTLLVLGTDRRWGEKGRGNSDTVILVRVDPDAKTVSLLSIPRDLRVPIDGLGERKINAAYAHGGTKLLVATVRDYFGVKIDHFVQVDMAGFRHIIKKLNGVYLPIDQRYYHRNDGTPANNWSAINIKPGYQKVGEIKALQFARFRYLDSDAYRVARQQLFLREVGRQAKVQLSKPTQILSMLRKTAKAITSDLASVKETAIIANTMRTASADHLNRVTVRGSEARIGGIDYLLVTPAQKKTALRRWAYPGRKIAHQRPQLARKRLRRRPPNLVSDQGRGRALLAPLSGLERCYPTVLPNNYSWGTARRYSLAGHVTDTAYATAGSGRSLLWMWTRWQDPPILTDPTTSLRRKGRRYDLYYESGRLRMVAWRLGMTRAWVTNTLRNEMGEKTMLALATSCRPFNKIDPETAAWARALGRAVAILLSK